MEDNFKPISGFTRYEVSGSIVRNRKTKTIIKPERNGTYMLHDDSGERQNIKIPKAAEEAPKIIEKPVIPISEAVEKKSAKKEEKVAEETTAKEKPVEKEEEKTEQKPEKKSAKEKKKEAKEAAKAKKAEEKEARKAAKAEKAAKKEKPAKKEKKEKPAKAPKEKKEKPAGSDKIEYAKGDKVKFTDVKTKKEHTGIVKAARLYKGKPFIEIEAKGFDKVIYRYQDKVSKG